MAWRKAVTCIFSLPKTLRSLATPEFSWVHCYFLSSVSCKTRSCNLSGVCCIFSDIWPYSGANLPGLRLWHMGRRQLWGAGGALLLEMLSPARESSCTSPLLQVPHPCSKGCRCLPGAVQNWLFPQSEVWVCQSLWCWWWLGELSLSPNCKCCFNQCPHSPTWGSLWPTPCSWLILWLPWSWVSKKIKAKLTYRTMGLEFFTEQDFHVKISRLSWLTGAHKKYLCEPFRGSQSTACSILFSISPGVSVSSVNSCVGWSWDWILHLICVTCVIQSNWKAAQQFALRHPWKTAGMH